MSNLSYMVIGVRQNGLHEVVTPEDKPISRKSAQRLSSAVLNVKDDGSLFPRYTKAHVIEIVDTFHPEPQ